MLFKDNRPKRTSRNWSMSRGENFYLQLRFKPKSAPPTPVMGPKDWEITEEWELERGTPSEVKGPLSKKSHCWRSFPIKGQAPKSFD